MQYQYEIIRWYFLSDFCYKKQVIWYVLDEPILICICASLKWFPYQVSCSLAIWHSYYSVQIDFIFNGDVLGSLWHYLWLIFDIYHHLQWLIFTLEWLYDLVSQPSLTSFSRLRLQLSFSIQQVYQIRRTLWRVSGWHRWLSYIYCFVFILFLLICPIPSHYLGFELL